MLKANDLLNDSLASALQMVGLTDDKNIEFIVIPTKKEEKYSTWDDMFRIWSTPLFTGVRLSKSEVIEWLSKAIKNTLPLWIKMSYQEGFPIILEFSQRFRKTKDVMERNPNNKIAPFEIENRSDIEEIVNNERQEAMRIVLFKRSADDKLKSIIGDEVRFEEIEELLKNHLKKYRFYPPNPSNRKQGNLDYSPITINQDFETGVFSICKTENLQHEVKSGLKLGEVVNYFIENEIKNDFFGVRIKK